jgi:hypothetical protein
MGQKLWNWAKWMLPPLSHFLWYFVTVVKSLINTIETALRHLLFFVFSYLSYIKSCHIWNCRINGVSLWTVCILQNQFQSIYDCLRTDSPWLRTHGGSRRSVFFTMVRKVYALKRSYILNFDLFPGKWYVVLHAQCWAATVSHTHDHVISMLAPQGISVGSVPGPTLCGCWSLIIRQHIICIDPTHVLPYALGYLCLTLYVRYLLC